MNIYTQTVPYFYIIRNKQTGIMYAGSKWAKGCHPEHFMIEKGYLTSSLTIHSIIEQFGLGIFEILRIDTYCDGIHVYDYETLFLETNDCAGSNDWYNQHNNTCYFPFGTESHNNGIFEKYGVDNISQLEEIKEKKKETSLKNWGFEHTLQSPIVREKGKKTCLIIYGKESHNSSPIVIQKKKEKYIKNWGVEHYAKVKKHCSFCGEYKNVTHEYKCPLNPNRKMLNVSGENNPRAITYFVISPDNENFTIKTEKNLKIFAKENNINFKSLIDNNIEGWKISRHSIRKEK